MPPQGQPKRLRPWNLRKSRRLRESQRLRRRQRRRLPSRKPPPALRRGSRTNDASWLFDNQAVAHDDAAVGHRGQMLVVGYDDKRLPQPLAQVEEELVKLGFVVRVETT